MNRTELIQFALRFLKSNLDDDAVLVINGRDTATDDEFAEYMVDFAESAIDDALCLITDGILAHDEYINQNAMVCPVCGAHDIEIVESTDESDGLVTQREFCNDCGVRYESSWLLIGVVEHSLE